MHDIPLNKPCLTGKEAHYIYKAANSGKLAGNGQFTQAAHDFFKNRYGFKHCLLTTSCTDALEMAALLCEIQEGDEVIMPSYTFVSTANAFVLRGARIIFCDSRSDHPGMDENSIEALISDNTKAIVAVHYGGGACEMDKIMEMSKKYGVFVVEDAAQAIDSYYYDECGSKNPLGSIGHFAAFSFHETKNIISGEGGMLVVNDEKYQKRAEIIWEKGTNRSAFFRGEVDKYGWVDVGSSFLPSELTAAFLWAQLEDLEEIQATRSQIWQNYHGNLKEWAEKQNVRLPFIPNYATNNGHLFYLVFQGTEKRQKFIDELKKFSIQAVFHYLSLHKSPYYKKLYEGVQLPNSDFYTDCLVRLPFYNELTSEEQQKVIETIKHIEL